MGSDEKQEHEASGLSPVEAALAYGGKLYDKPEDFDVALDHIAGLLDDATTLFERGSFATAAFLSITALEETGKAHVGAFRRDKPGIMPKGRDPLRDHKAKHRMAVLPTVFMSARIIDALGRDRADALHKEAHAAGFAAMREAALYCARNASGFESPRDAIPPRISWEFLILAIEAADDALVGYTNHSYEVGTGFDALFVRVAARRPT
jgi:AbiV family abortive infection protein